MEDDRQLDENSSSRDLENGLPTNKASELPTDGNPNQTAQDVIPVENPNHQLQHQHNKNETLFARIKSDFLQWFTLIVQFFLFATVYQNFVAQQGVATLGGAEEPVPQGSASPSTDETNHKKMIEEEIHKANGKFKLEFASFALMLGCSEFSWMMFLPKKSANENILKAISILGFFDIIAAFCLLIHTSFMFARSNTFPGSIHDTISKCLLIISCMALLSSLIPLLMQLPSPYNLLIPIALAVVLLTLCINLYLRSKTNDKNTEKDPTEYEEPMKEIQRLSDLNQGLVTLSSGGLIGILFGIQKNTSNHANQPLVPASVLLLLASFLLSVCLMHLCQMKWIHLRPRTRKNFLRVGEGLCKFLVVMLALSAIAIAFKFLKWYTVMVFIPVLIVCAIWIIESCTMVPHNIRDALEEEDHSIKKKKDEDLSIKKKEEEEDLKLTYTKASKVTSISFGGITAIFSGYLRTNEENMDLNVCMILLASCFICGQILMLTSYKPSKRPHNIASSVITILTFFAMSLLLFSAFTIFIVVFMRL